MQRIFYPCEISQDEEGYQVQFTDFPEGFTDGDSLEEAITRGVTVFLFKAWERPA